MVFVHIKEVVAVYDILEGRKLSANVDFTRVLKEDDLQESQIPFHLNGTQNMYNAYAVQTEQESLTGHMPSIKNH